MAYNIKRDSWAIIERVIRRYPENKEEYNNKASEIMSTGHSNDGQPRSNLPGNPTEKAVLEFNTPRMQRIKREIEAVEKVYTVLSSDHQKVIRVRFWSNRYRNMPYLWMESCVSYKEAQMKRIAGNFIKKVGIELGEIER